MAIILEGKSKCPLCGRVLNESQEYLLVPPLTSNKKDSLFLFSDNGVHKECLQKNPFRESLNYHINKYDQRISLSKSICIIDGQLITNPKNIISFGMLTSNPDEDLFKFNYITINKENVRKWKERDAFILSVSRFNADKKWESITNFNYLEYLVKEINN